jgi:CheY-like chemotaxis protein
MKERKRGPGIIVFAEDDEDDFLLTTRALKTARVVHEMHRVRDGRELLDYLHRRGEFADHANHPYPTLVVLDLNMPRMDGREALREIRADAKFEHLPIVVLTTSRAEEDVTRSYRLGANAFMQKPLGFDELVETMRSFGRYWFEVVELPPTGPLREGELS